MTEAPELDLSEPPVTDGNIAVNNLESARQRSWSRFWQSPLRAGIAEYLVEQEQLTAQFLGDLSALDRLDSLAGHLERVDPKSSRTALIRAQVASAAHHFADARRCVDRADGLSETAAAHRLSLSIDQACGTRPDAVLDIRWRMAEESGRLEDLVPLGSLLADFREFDEADRCYRRALITYQDTSPFAVAWACFQLGVLWGELVSKPQSSRAAWWYRRAIEYLPCYVKARVHLAELYLRDGQIEDAKDLLMPALSSGDPEVSWRLADVQAAMERFEDAAFWIRTAQSGFETLLTKHLLAFADHGAEFYSGSGNDPGRALELARVNLANRPTLRAFEQAYATAVAMGVSDSALGILAAAE
jgi:tetratricopeptide (TPR) repeat protein